MDTANTIEGFSWGGSTMILVTLIALIIAAALEEVGGDYLIRVGLPRAEWSRMLPGALALSLYGFAVNLFWRGDFSRLLGLYVVLGGERATRYAPIPRRRSHCGGRIRDSVLAVKMSHYRPCDTLTPR